MKTSIFTLAIALALSFTAAPADALDNLAKCRVYNAQIKMNYAKCLELDILLVEKGKSAKGICESKRTASLEKATKKFVTKLGVVADDCRIDLAPATADQVLQLFGSGATLTESQLNTLSSNSTIETIAAAAEQAACAEANGTWESGTCTAALSYNCTVGAMCSSWAAEYPLDLPLYTNNYVDHTAASTGCSSSFWDWFRNSITRDDIRATYDGVILSYPYLLICE